jgi:hypothetical protein
MTLLSPLAAAVAELAADASVQAIVGLDANGVRRVRPIEPLGTVGTTQGDSRGAGEYIPFLVLSVLDDPARQQIPIRDVVLGIRAYGATYAAAEALWLAAEAVFRGRGARRATSGLGVWWSTCRSIGPDRDPATLQPLWHGTVTYPTTIGSV